MQLSQKLKSGKGVSVKKRVKELFYKEDIKKKLSRRHIHVFCISLDLCVMSLNIKLHQLYNLVQYTPIVQ